MEQSPEPKKKKDSQSRNTFLPSLSQNHDSVNRRHLPIEERKKVFNEWGAILRHQDEVEQRVQQDQMAQQRHYKEAFRANLDEQRLQRERDVKAKRDRDRSDEMEMIRAQQELQQRRFLQDEKKRQEIRDSVKQRAKESLQEKEK